MAEDKKQPDENEKGPEETGQAPPVFEGPNAIAYMERNGLEKGASDSQALDWLYTQLLSAARWREAVDIMRSHGAEGRTPEEYEDWLRQALSRARYLREGLPEESPDPDEAPPAEREETVPSELSGGGFDEDGVFRDAKGNVVMLSSEPPAPANEPD